MTTPQEASRAAFEAWDKRRWDIHPGLYARFKGYGEYKDWPIRCRWETWQASTSAHASEVAKLREALTQALNALRLAENYSDHPLYEKPMTEAIAAARAALQNSAGDGAAGVTPSDGGERK